jgi:hypothetical protein
MTVYHGNDTQIEVIDLDKCKHGRDFGHGFYVTKLQEQARTMAKRVSRWSKKEPVVTGFEFDEMALIDKDLKVLQFADYNEGWLDFVALNRKQKRPISTTLPKRIPNLPTKQPGFTKNHGQRFTKCLKRN